jgi:hypothetical protein
MSIAGAQKLRAIVGGAAVGAAAITIAILGTWLYFILRGY